MAIIPIQNKYPDRAGYLGLDTDRNVLVGMSDGILQDMTNSTPEGWVNVKDFGAKGDGITDDTIAIQSALDKGGNIYIPEGHYIISEILNVYSDTYIYGVYDKSFIEEKEGIFRIFTSSNSSNLRFKNLKLKKLVDPEYTGEFKHIISLYSVTDVVIENCKILDNDGDGIVIGKDSITNIIPSNILIINSLFDNSKRNGITVVSGKNIKIINNTFKNITRTNPKSGIDLEFKADEGNNNITIDSNYFENCNNGLIFSTYAKNGIVSRNYFYNNGIDVYIRNSTNINEIRNIIIEQNLSINSNHFLYAYKDISNLLIKDNTIYNSSEFAMQVNGKNNIKIENNLIDTTGDRGIIIQNLENSSVSYNNIYKTAKSGIYSVDYISNTKISDNVLIDCGLHENSGRWQMLLIDISNSTISNNIMRQKDLVLNLGLKCIRDENLFITGNDFRNSGNIGTGLEYAGLNNIIKNNIDKDGNYLEV